MNLSDYYYNVPSQGPTSNLTPNISASGPGYSTQILTGTNNEQKYKTGKTPMLKPGQMMFRNNLYYWIDPADGQVKKTAGIQTAYAASGVTAGETPGSITEAFNQKFNLGGGQIQLDKATGAYYFKDPNTGKMLTTTDLSTAYSTLYPTKTTSASDVSETNPFGMHARTETYESGMRPSAEGEQFYAPVYKQQYQNYAQPNYSLMGNQAGLGALSAVQGQNTQGTARTYGVPMAPVSQYTNYANMTPTGMGQVRNPFSINPANYAQNVYTPANYGNFANMAQRFATPASAAQSYYGQGMQSGVGSTATPFSSGSQGAFGGGVGGTGLYGKP